MKLYLDRNKTLLPRLDTIYLVSRIGILLSLIWYIFDNSLYTTDPNLIYIMMGTYLIHLLVFYRAICGKFDIKLAYFSSLIYDIIVIPLIILYTGGINSPYYTLFLLTISVAAYLLRFWFAIAVTGAVVFAYLLAVKDNLNLDSAFDITYIVGLFVVFYLAISYGSDYMRKSEKRMLKLFDTLNMRTSELEKYQGQMEIIYENIRNMATILQPDDVIKAIMRIINSVLGYAHGAIVFRDNSDRYVYRARLISRKNNYQLLALNTKLFPLVKQVCELDEPVRIKDTTNREDFIPLSENTKSAMMVPMNSHGRINGVLIVESETPNQFSDRDLQTLSTVARSAAMTLENAELHKQTKELSIIDDLTGAYNYRYFIRKLQEEKRRASRYALPLSLIMVDIDWFKKFNDSYGHEVGNIVLRDLAKIIHSCIRDVDIFVRYGGEEFVVILPQTPQNEAIVIGNRIREQVEKTAIDAGKHGLLNVTVSVGISSFPENGRPQEELVTVADEALYQAKDEGRNLVCVR
ncbi:MAG: sensor domain-containing diguanylate cyclase [bacterium]